MSTPVYYPRPGSLAAQVVYFFRTNPDEVLTVEDIVNKFDAPRGNIHTQLRPAVEVDLLRRGRNDEGEYTYQGGVRIEVINKSGETPVPKARKPESYASPRHAIDIDALVVEKGVPMTPTRPGFAPKWDPLFDKLTEVGDSIEVPAKLRAALASAAATRNKRHQGYFRVLLTSGGKARVWRVQPPKSAATPPASKPGVRHV